MRWRVDTIGEIIEGLEREWANIDEAHQENLGHLLLGLHDSLIAIAAELQPRRRHH